MGDVENRELSGRGVMRERRSVVAQIRNTAREASKGNDIIAAGTLSPRMYTTQEEA